MTGFQSANLKQLYEEARDLGIPLTASEMALLFSDGDLEDIIDEARSTLDKIVNLIERIAEISAFILTLAPDDPTRIANEELLIELTEELEELQEMWSSGELWD